MDHEHGRVHRVLVTFIGFGLLVMLVILLGAVVVIRQVAQRQALTEGEVMTSRLATYVIAPVIADVLDDDTEKRRELDRLLDLRIQDGTMTEVNVWSIDGQILYSDDLASIGRRFPAPDEVVAAITGGRTSSTIEAEPESGRGGEGNVVEVYTPLDLPDRVLAFEVYYSYRSVEDQAEKLTAQIVPLAIGPLLLLQLVQVPIAVSLARRVRRYEAERARLLAQALSASDRERAQIAADLHDGVVQDLAGVGYAVGALSRSVPAEHREIADKVGVTVRGAVDTLRRLMVDIYPPDLSGSGLATAITGLTDSARRAGLDVDLAIEPLPAMDQEVAAALYRTAREALLNVLKHAHASRAQVRLGPDSDPGWPGRGAVRLQIADDGIGLPADWGNRRSEGHLGLQILVDRIAHVGGELVLAPGPTGGTVVDARVPTVCGEPGVDIPQMRGSRLPHRRLPEQRTLRHAPQDSANDEEADAREHSRAAGSRERS